MTKRGKTRITGTIGPVTGKSRKVSVRTLEGQNVSFNACIITDYELEDGQKIEAFGSFYPLPFSTNPHQFDYGRFLLENSMEILFYSDSLKILENSSRPVDVLRNHIRKTITEEFNDDSAVAAFALAVSIGDRLFLDDELREDFLGGGISHVLAISGLHVGIILLMALITFRAAGIPVKPSYFLTGAVVVFYLLISGGHPSAWRASIGALVLLSSLFFQRERNPYQITGIAGLVVLAKNPLSLWNPGFLMSFGSVLGLISFLPPVIAWSERKGARKFFVVIICGLSAPVIVNICILPVTTATFGKIFLLSPLANLIVIPFLHVFIFTLFFYLLFPFRLFAGALWLAGRTIILTAKTFSSFSPFVFTRTFSPAESVLFVATLVFLKISLVKRRFLSISLLSAAVFFFLFFARRTFLEKSWVLFFDVGQGNACLLHSAGGTDLLIDAGKNERTGSLIAHYAELELGGSIEAAVATHQDMDHIGGMAEIIRRLKPGRIFFNGVLKNKDSISEFMSLAGGSLIELSRGDSIYAGNFAFRVHSPQKSEKPEYSVDQNRYSIFMTAVFENCLIVFPGDAVLFYDESFAGSRSVILLLSHHGDFKANPFNSISLIDPDLTVISAGRKNPYGHPAEDLVGFLQKRGSSDFRTDRDGAVKIFLPDLSVKCYNDSSYLWHFCRSRFFGK